jgi:hypothetical protein
MAEVRGQKTEDRGIGIRNAECGSGKKENNTTIQNANLYFSELGYLSTKYGSKTINQRRTSP